MKKNIISFALVAMIGIFNCGAVLDAGTGSGTADKKALFYEAEVIGNGFAGCLSDQSQSAPEEDFWGDWERYPASVPGREYEA